MKTITLIAYRDDNTGEIGLGLKGMSRGDETNAAINGALIAHDLIEHVNGPKHIGSIDDELEALGASVYVRAQWGELQRNSRSVYSPEQNIASDVVRMFREYVCGAYVAPMKFRPRGGRVTHQEALEQVMALAADDWRAEIDAEDLDEAVPLWEAYSAIAMQRMQTGYAKARRKWEPRGQFAANNQFWAIADAVDTMLKHEELIEGMEFKLRYGNGEAICTAEYEY